MGAMLTLEKKFKNFVIEYAENYADIKEKIRTERFDLLILDIELPGSIFKAMIKDLKSLQEDLLILIFTSYQKISLSSILKKKQTVFLTNSVKKKILSWLWNQFLKILFIFLRE